MSTVPHSCPPPVMPALTADDARNAPFVEWPRTDPAYLVGDVLAPSPPPALDLASMRVSPRWCLGGRAVYGRGGLSGGVRHYCGWLPCDGFHIRGAAERPHKHWPVFGVPTALPTEAGQ